MDPQQEAPTPDSESETDSGAPRWASRRLLLALSLFVGALLVILLLVDRSGIADRRLDARLLTLELSYPAGQAAVVRVVGQPNAAPGGATITCRSTDNHQRLGRAIAHGDGSIDIVLDPAPWPLDSLTGDGAKTINTRVECRVGSGDWVMPLRQPRVHIN